MSVAEVLSGVWLFSGIDKEHLEALAAFTFTRDYKPGATIVEQGRTGNGLYVVMSGRVEVVEGLYTENPRRLATLGEGEFFGEMALLEEKPRSATVRALQETTCVGMDRWLFIAQLRRDPEIAILMLQAMARRLRETDAKLTQ